MKRRNPPPPAPQSLPPSAPACMALSYHSSILLLVILLERCRFNCQLSLRMQPKRATSKPPLLLSCCNWIACSRIRDRGPSCTGVLAFCSLRTELLSRWCPVQNIIMHSNKPLGPPLFSRCGSTVTPPPGLKQKKLSPPNAAAY